MAVDAAVNVDHELAAARLGLHRGDPLGGWPSSSSTPSRAADSTTRAIASSRLVPVAMRCLSPTLTQCRLGGIMATPERE